MQLNQQNDLQEPQNKLTQYCKWTMSTNQKSFIATSLKSAIKKYSLTTASQLNWLSVACLGFYSVLSRMSLEIFSRSREKERILRLSGTGLQTHWSIKGWSEKQLRLSRFASKSGTRAERTISSINAYQPTVECPAKPEWNSSSNESESLPRQRCLPSPSKPLRMSCDATTKKKEEKGKNYTIKRRPGLGCVFPNLRTLSIPRHTQHQNTTESSFIFSSFLHPKYKKKTHKIPLATSACWLNHFQLIRRTVNIFTFI